MPARAPAAEFGTKLPPSIAPPLRAGTGPLRLNPLRRRAASSGAAHELGGVERAGGRGPADVDAEGSGAQDAQRLGVEAAGRKLDGGRVGDGEQAGIGGVAAEGVQ